MRQLFILCCCLMTITGLAQIDLDLGLQAHYNFDNNVLDQSEHANHGALNGTPTYLFGVNENCISFNEVTDFVAINNGLQLGASYTISAWIRTNTLSPDWQTVISKYETNNYGPYWFGLHNDKLNFWISDGNGGYLDFDSERSIEADTWYHVFWVLEDGLGTMYVDCAFDSAFDNVPTLTQNNDLVTIGVQALYLPQTSNYANFEGAIDELRIYDRVLNEEELSTLCKGGLTNVEEEYAEKRISAFPNPASTQVDIKIEGISPQAMLRIKNLQGQIVRDFLMEQETMNVDIADLAKGYYIISVEHEQDQFITPLIIQ